jgi:hypothetical protein
MLLITATVDEFVGYLKYAGSNCPYVNLSDLTDPALKQYVRDCVQLYPESNTPKIYFSPGDENVVKIEFSTNFEDPPSWGDDFIKRIQEYICTVYSPRQADIIPPASKSIIEEYWWAFLIGAIGIYYIVKD